MIKNPILRGFNPDPSIIRVGKDYYIATSTFEWFPGVQIHHSTDLVNWELRTRPLNRLSQLDMAGNPDSCGVWAPCLSYDRGVFHLVYSNVRSFNGVWKDTPNYLVTTTDILGDWSEPIFLSASGFDGSLFHDEDGRKWFTSMLVDHRNGTLFGGIILQEYSSEQQQLIGKIHHIFQGTELGITEAPHLYKRNGWYYLLTAEGGTEYGHAVSLARSKSIFGPYEIHPQNPILSTRSLPEAALQKCGHADIVATPQGAWYMVFLTGRPLGTRGQCTLGRETAIEEVEWQSDDWLYLKNGVDQPRMRISIASPKTNKTETPNRIYFDPTELDINFQSLRIPITEQWASLKARDRCLRLYGQESLSSLHRQSMIARRVQDFEVEAATCLEFEPSHFQQMAGLVTYYNTGHWYYLHLLGSDIDKTGKKFLQITACDNFNTRDVLVQPIELTGEQQVQLKVRFYRNNITFYYARQAEAWEAIGTVLDGRILSDDYVREGSSRYRPAFTGAFIGICCQDLAGTRKAADFLWFEYVEK